MLRPIYEFPVQLGTPPPIVCLQLRNKNADWWTGTTTLHAPRMDEYDDSPFSYLWMSMTTLRYLTCGRVWRLSTLALVNMLPPERRTTPLSLSLSLSRPRLHLSLFWSLLKLRGRSRVTFEAAMHIASLCRVRSDTMDITCHPNIFLHVGSPTWSQELKISNKSRVRHRSREVPNSWSARHGTVK